MELATAAAIGMFIALAVVVLPLMILLFVGRNLSDDEFARLKRALIEGWRF